MFPNLANMFNSAPAAPEVAPAQPANQGNIPGAPTVATDPNNPNAPAAAAALPEVPAVAGMDSPDSSLESFANLWDAVPKKEGAPTAPDTLDPAKLQEVIGKANLAATMTPQQIEAISAGGEGAVTAFNESMNTGLQQVMLQSTLASNKMIEQAVGKVNTAELPAECAGLFTCTP